MYILMLISLFLFTNQLNRMATVFYTVFIIIFEYIKLVVYFKMAYLIQTFPLHITYISYLFSFTLLNIHVITHIIHKYAYFEIHRMNECREWTN